MHITLTREILLNPLQKVISVVERKQTMPILGNVLLSVTEKNLSITATDTEVELVGQIELDQPSSKFTQVTVPGRKLMDICRSLPDEVDITLEHQKDKIILRSGRSRFSLTTLPFEEFPRLEKNEGTLEFTINQKDLRFLIQRTQFAMANQDVRYFLNGMLLEVSEGVIRTVATDGHRLALNTVAAQVINSTFLQVIIPRKAITELVRLIDNADEELKVTVSSDCIRIIGPGYMFTSKLIDGRFPDYERVLPKHGDKIIIMDRNELKQALSRAIILSNEKSRSVRLQFRENLLHILANNPEQEEAEEIIQIDYTHEDMDIALNASYLIEILNSFNEGDVKMSLSTPDNSVLIEELAHEGNSLYVIMPMHL